MICIYMLNAYNKVHYTLDCTILAFIDLLKESEDIYATLFTLTLWKEKKNLFPLFLKYCVKVESSSISAQ